MTQPHPTQAFPEAGSEQERTQFQALQQELVPRFHRFRGDPRLPYTAVVVPSQSFDPHELAKITGVAHYEQRSLVNLMLLRRPRLKVIFVTSKKVDSLIIDYYLHQMRGVPAAHARARLLLLDCDDASPRPLSEKILERPRLLRRIHDAIDDPEMAHLAVFNSSPLERTLAVRLGIPLNGCDPDLRELGSKTGSRRAFAAAGVPYVPGREGLRDSLDLSEALADLWEERPQTRRMVVKLNESFSGEGNALLQLAPLAHVAPGKGNHNLRAAAIREALPSLELEAAGTSFEDYRSQFDQMGGVCETWLEGKGKRAPSVQVRINPAREVQVVSTHEQVLGGPNGQIFLGADFPALEDCRSLLQHEGLRVGRQLADQGVLGRLSVDFLTIPDPDPKALPSVHAVEINLRPGGTTHTFNMLKFLTDGRYDAELGVFRTAQGQSRCYFGTDNLASESYRGLMLVDLIDAMVLEGMHFRPDETGVVFHLLGCLSEFGKLGCMAVAATPEEARELYNSTVALLDGITSGGTPTSRG